MLNGKSEKHREEKQAISAVVWTNDSLVFFYVREMAFKVLGVDLAKDSLVFF